MSEYSMSNKKGEMAQKMHQKYTMNAVTPTSKSRGMKYSGTAKFNQGKVTMNASVPGARTGEKPEQSYTKKNKQRSTMNAVKGTYHGGEKFPQADSTGAFESGYSQHGKRS